MALYIINDLNYMLEVDGVFGWEDDDPDDPTEGGEQQSHGGDGGPDGKSESEMPASTPGARKCKDMQGIPWERTSFTRHEFRKIRLRRYRNYEDLAHSPEQLQKDCKQVEKRSTFYDFKSNIRNVNPRIGHFQLRNLLWATSKHDIYMMQNYSVRHWSSLKRESTQVLNVARRIVLMQRPTGSSTQSVWKVKITAMAVKNNLLVAGGMHGELICKDPNRPGVVFSTKVTNDENAITNSVDISQKTSPPLLITANNDCGVRIFDTEKFTLLGRFTFPWSVNSTTASPDGKMLAVLGDDVDGLVADAKSGKAIGSLKGHLDYSFASAWHPAGHILATGNQDRTCRLWDVRKLSESLAVLKGRIGAIRSIKFSSDGQFMAMAESADFVHVYDVNAGFNRAQEIDLFGEISGLSFSPDAECLFLSISDRKYGSLLEFNRRHQYRYMDCFA